MTRQQLSSSQSPPPVVNGDDSHTSSSATTTPRDTPTNRGFFHTRSSSLTSMRDQAVRVLWIYFISFQCLTYLKGNIDLQKLFLLLNYFSFIIIEYELAIHTYSGLNSLLLSPIVTFWGMQHFNLTSIFIG